MLIAAHCAALQWGVFVTDCAQKVGILWKLLLSTEFNKPQLAQGAARRN